jgi:ParB/RepB/Spo0J family partition protein
VEIKVEEIALSKIVEQERRRTDCGDISALAAGIKRVGLIEPIVIDRMDNGFFRLVAGSRRLRAVRQLKWARIPAVLKDALSAAEMRDIELEENENRKGLTAAERRRTFASAKRIVESAKQAKKTLPRVGRVSKRSVGQHRSRHPPRPSPLHLERLANRSNAPSSRLNSRNAISGLQSEVSVRAPPPRASPRGRQLCEADLPLSSLPAHRARPGTLARGELTRTLAPRALLALLKQRDHVAGRQVARLKEKRLVARGLRKALAHDLQTFAAAEDGGDHLAVAQNREDVLPLPGGIDVGSHLQFAALGHSHILAHTQVSARMGGAGRLEHLGIQKSTMA